MSRAIASEIELQRELNDSWIIIRRDNMPEITGFYDLSDAELQNKIEAEGVECFKMAASQLLNVGLPSPCSISSLLCVVLILNTGAA